jgi:hypothetical protein
MILALLSLFSINLLAFITSLFPAVDSNILASITNFSAPFRARIVYANYFFPIPTFFTILSIVFALEVVYFWIRIGAFGLRILTGR